VIRLAQTALEWIRRGDPFDLVITDLQMPGMDGIALARAIRQLRDAESLPLVLYSSLGGREAGVTPGLFDAALMKPLHPSLLLDTLVSIFGSAARQVAGPIAQPALEVDREMAARRPLRILLAEDIVVNQKLALRYLDKLGYRADVAANGLEAIDALERQPYDVILMDVQMPEMDGLEASRRICARWPREQRPAIIAMTANAMEGDREMCLAAGMDDYISKPIRVEELMAALLKVQPVKVSRCSEPITMCVLETILSVMQRCRKRARGSLIPGRARASRSTLREILRRKSDQNDTLKNRCPLKHMPTIDLPTFEKLKSDAGADFVGELIETYCSETPQLIAKLRYALDVNDAGAFRQAAHSIKSTSKPLARCHWARWQRLEMLGRAGDLAGAQEKVDRLAAEYDRVQQALEDLRHD
jgi:CheY-like chemotaxis protein